LSPYFARSFDLLHLYFLLSKHELELYSNLFYDILATSVLIFYIA